MSLEEIEREIRTCKKCELWKYKTNYVPGEGNPRAKIVLIGEAPGREEDLQGKPFVGKAGKYLTDVLKRIGVERSDVYITNVLKCRPPNNRDPKPEEISACKPHLIKQLETIKPDVIVCLGRFSADVILNEFGLGFKGISKDRGKVFEVERWGKVVKILPTYHPAAVLRNKTLEKYFEGDLSKAVNLMRKPKTLFDFFK
jgi:DNA polymerase